MQKLFASVILASVPSLAYDNYEHWIDVRFSHGCSTSSCPVEVRLSETAFEMYFPHKNVQNSGVTTFTNSATVSSCHLFSKLSITMYNTPGSGYLGIDCSATDSVKLSCYDMVLDEVVYSEIKCEDHTWGNQGSGTCDSGSVMWLDPGDSCYVYMG